MRCGAVPKRTARKLAELALWQAAAARLVAQKNASNGSRGANMLYRGRRQQPIDEAFPLRVEVGIVEAVPVVEPVVKAAAEILDVHDPRKFVDFEVVEEAADIVRLRDPKPVSAEGGLLGRLVVVEAQVLDVLAGRRVRGGRGRAARSEEREHRRETPGSC
eukprot:SAG22_NODE_1960_length_3248_cov_2.405208_7_plen_161_part_00